MLAVGNIPLCVGQDVRCEAAIHSIYDKYMFKSHGTAAVLLVNAENTFNFLNRQICPT